jgi:hypothetical protein
MPHKRKDLKIEGQNLWYLVGLITSDGCLSSDKRHIDITSKDKDFLTELKEAVSINNKIGIKYNIIKQKAYHIQFANRNFYDFLLSVGLTPNKSLTLGTLNVPDKFFVDFLRGLIDGDGCIRTWIHPSNKKEQWSLRIYSGASVFINWLKNVIVSLLKTKGRIYREKSNIWTLKYGKMAAREIVTKCYYDGCFGLQRKIILAKNCITSYKGWSKSYTVNC